MLPLELINLINKYDTIRMLGFMKRVIWNSGISCLSIPRIVAHDIRYIPVILT